MATSSLYARPLPKKWTFRTWHGSAPDLLLTELHIIRVFLYGAYYTFRWDHSTISKPHAY